VDNELCLDFVVLEAGLQVSARTT